MVAERRLIDRMVGEVNASWATAFGAVIEERSDGTFWTFTSGYETFPDDKSVRLFLHRLPAAIVLDAVDETASRCKQATEGACRYFYAICWRRIKNPER